MFEPLYVHMLEKTLPRTSFPAFLADVTSISIKTWETGGPKRAAAKERAAKEIDAYFTNQLRSKGVSDADIATWRAQFMSPTDQAPSYLSQIVRTFSVNQEHPPETLALAGRMDELAHALWKANVNGDFEGCKQTLLNSPFLDKTYFADTERELCTEAVPHAFQEAERATVWDDLDQSIKAAGANMLLSLLACWDLEFCQRYFSAMAPFPLFEVLMLRTSCDLSDNPTLGRDTVYRPIRNLIDLIAILADWARNRSPKGSRTVPLQDVAARLQLSDPQIPEHKLWNWRRGRDVFYLADLDVIWQRLLGVDDNDRTHRVNPPPPLPLFAAATIWTQLQLHADPALRTGELLFIQPWYLWWWDFHHNRLAAKGVAWGDRPWPEGITCQSSWPGARSPDSNLSSQSSGRSSKSRDSQ